MNFNDYLPISTLLTLFRALRVPVIFVAQRTQSRSQRTQGL